LSWSQSLLQTGLGAGDNVSFNIVEVGDQPDNLYTAGCNVRHEDDGGIAYASCAGAFMDFRFIPDGEFLVTRLYSMPEDEPDAERDSMAIFVGKCSVIEP
jgi:hypothetical protein